MCAAQIAQLHYFCVANQGCYSVEVLLEIKCFAGHHLVLEQEVLYKCLGGKIF